MKRLMNISGMILLMVLSLSATFHELVAEDGAAATFAVR